MTNSAVRTERERRVKATESVRGLVEAPTIEQTAARILRELVDDAARSLKRVNDGKVGEKRVHKLRGTLRKLEIMTGALGCGFESKTVERLAKSVKRQRKTAGGVRDMDVAAALVKMICAGAGGDAAAWEESVVATFMKRRERAMKKLVALSEKEFGKLAADLQSVLDASAGRRAMLPARSAFVVALARESTAMRDAVRAGLDTPELLHELRLNLKEARTIMELAGDVMGDDAARIAETAKNLSDVLGEVNDLATLVELLGSLEEKGSKKSREAAKRLRAIVMAAHASGHERGVSLAMREVPDLIGSIRMIAFGEAETLRG